MKRRATLQRFGARCDLCGAVLYALTAVGLRDTWTEHRAKHSAQITKAVRELSRELAERKQADLFSGGDQ